MSCLIRLNNPGIFGPGDNVTGKIICTFPHRENIRGIKCKLRGKEHTFWAEQRGRSQVRYTGERMFVVADMNFIGEGRINEGVYEYPFSFKLPESNIPSSYQHRYGSIRYYISAKVDRPFAFDFKDEVTLHVAVPINFNNIIQQIQWVPVTYQTETQTGCCMCVSDFVTLSMTLEKDYFVLGETAKVKVHVDNKSNVEIEEIIVQLSSTIQFITHRPSTRYKYEKNMLSIQNGSSVAARTQKTYDFSLHVPQTALIPSFLGCTLFKQWCSISVEAVFPPFHTNLPLEVHVKLGHISFTIDQDHINFSNNIVGQTLGEFYNNFESDVPPYPVNNPNGHPPIPLPSRENDRRPTASVGLAPQEDFTLGVRDTTSPPPTYDQVMSQHLQSPKIRY